MLWRDKIKGFTELKKKELGVLYPKIDFNFVKYIPELPLKDCTGFNKHEEKVNCKIPTMVIVPWMKVEDDVDELENILMSSCFYVMTSEVEIYPLEIFIDRSHPWFDCLFYEGLLYGRLIIKGFYRVNKKGIKANTIISENVAKELNLI